MALQWMSWQINPVRSQIHHRRYCLLFGPLSAARMARRGRGTHGGAAE
jgi:hypothetical protein